MSLNLFTPNKGMKLVPGDRFAAPGSVFPHVGRVPRNMLGENPGTY